ncbi:hypothetical protein ACHAQA_008557 [Verticillium albo-atrum]
MAPNEYEVGSADPHAEAIVQNALDEASKDRTTVVIAHKLKTIQAANNIVLMKQGKIIEQGQHAELIARGGAYAALFKAQDLSATNEKATDCNSDQDQDQPTALEKSHSLGRHDTGAREKLSLLGKREEYGLASASGIVSTATKLLKGTPDLKWWYILALFTSIAGGDGRFHPQLDRSRANFFALMLFIMAICLLFIYMAIGWVSNHIAQAYGHDARKQMFAAYLRQDLRFFDQPDNLIGALTSRLDSDAQSLFELMGFNITMIMLSIVTVIACSVLSITVSWKLCLVGVFAGVPHMILGGYIYIRVETKMDSDIDTKFSKSASIASKSVTAIRTMSSLAIEDDILLRYTHELYTAISEFVEFFVLALGFWWGSKLIAAGDINFYQFIVSFMAVYFSGFTKANAAANYFFWLCGLEATVRETDQNRVFVQANGCTSYDFENMQFAYPLAPENHVLKGVSLNINPGQFVRLCGSFRLGKIAIDDTNNLADINPRLYRRAVSLVQQEPTLFPGTIRENMSMGIDQDADEETTVDDSTIEAGLRAANAWDFVSSLPEGLNTPCGTGGAQLSGGQR